MIRLLCLSSDLRPKKWPDLSLSSRPFSPPKVSCRRTARLRVGDRHLPIKQIIAERAVETVLLVDHTKFGRRALSKVLDISQIQRVITDERTRKSHLASLRRVGIKVDVASLAPMEHSQHAAHADQ